MDFDVTKHLKRMNELFKPIEQQILMTDDQNDLLLLSCIMFTTAKRIFIDRYGEEEAKKMIIDIIKQ